MGMVVNPYAFGYTPLQIADITAWFHSLDDSAFDLFSGNITGWRNLVIRSDDNARLVASNSPTRTSVNGRDMVSFNGSNQFFYAPSVHSAYQLGSGDFSIFTVSRSDDTNRGAILGQAGGTPFYIMRYNNADSNDGHLLCGIRDGSSNQLQLDISDITYNSNTVRILGMVRDGGTLRAYRGNTEIANGDVSSVGSTNDTNEGLNIGAIGGAPSFPGGGGAVQFLNGEIGEVIMVKRAISSQERADLVAWLTSRWGL